MTIMIVLLARTPKNTPGAIWFVGFTNYDGQKRLIFQGTNSIPGQKLLAILGTGAIPPATDSSGGLPAFIDAATGSAPPGTNFCFTLKVPANGTPYYVGWYFYDSQARRTRWGKVRGSIYKFLNTRGLPALAMRLAASPEMHFIPSSECKE